ncbi:hypothetical protein [Aliivibrio fischeri]|uniref:hypothetical protein n=1 Tax=Aliivibrio fischeri TaxID=668 RepID=UPI0007C5A0EF|nr:hypothetical protein [Aliivibrio fischeri]
MTPSVFESFEIKSTFLLGPKSSIQGMLKFTTKFNRKEKAAIIDCHFLTFIKSNLHELTCESMTDAITINFFDSSFDLDSQENALIGLLNGLENFSKCKRGLISGESNFNNKSLSSDYLCSVVDTFMDELDPDKFLLGVKVLWDAGLEQNAILLYQLIVLLSNHYYYKYN